MERGTWKKYAAAAGVLIGAFGVLASGSAEQRNETAHLRGPYNNAFFKRHNETFRVGSALHFSHAKQHDVLLLNRIEDYAKTDVGFDRESLEFVEQLKAKTEPTQDYYAPYMSRVGWRVLRSIDWVHQLHEQTYDIMSDPSIPWDEKKQWIDRSVRYYLANDVAFSPAPIDVTMRRVAVMMKPYFTYFRNYYPRSNNFFYGAHWWHPIVYEAQMIGGNDAEQDDALSDIERIYNDEVLAERPQRMLLLREAAPRYSRLSPESANIFDNLHMFHGIVYDILAYDGWSESQKRAELYRVIDALRYQPGDEALARKFEVPHEMDPRVYTDWMKGSDGEMTRIMMEMMQDMMPMMMAGTSADAHAQMRGPMMERMRMKLMPGMQPGESPGSLHAAMMELMPNMPMMPETMQPGATPRMMVDTMLAGWRDKHANLPDVAPMPMEAEPSLARLTPAMPEPELAAREDGAP